MNSAAKAIDGRTFDISFIIPSLNEEASIRKTLLRIIHNVPSELSYQIIVVDNGSVDRTAVIAKGLGAFVLTRPKVSVAELRNIGVINAAGKLLVFVDADISLTNDWKKHITDYYQTAIENMVVYGSKCSPTGKEGILSKCWFTPMTDNSNMSYVATGHMIISKSNFEYIGGFDPKLKTGEDYEFSQRAKANGFLLKNVPELRVFHLGFPKTLGQFFEREAWHGKGDIRSFETALNSKVFLAAFAFMASHVLFIISLLIKQPWLASTFVIFIITIPTFSSFYKFPYFNLNDRIINIFIYSVYLYARFFSIFYSKNKWR